MEPIWIILILAVLLIYYYVSMVVHEFTHLAILKLLGGDGYIDWMRGCVVITSPPLSVFAVACSGGIVLGIVLIIVTYLLLHYIDFGEEGEIFVLLLIPIAVFQVLYGIYEGVSVL